MDVDSLIDLLKDTANQTSPGDSDSPLLEFNLPTVWESLLPLTKSDPRSSKHILAPLLFHLASSKPSVFRAADIPCIDAEISDFANPSSSLAARFSSGSSLIQWLPALSLDYFRRILTSSVDFISDFVSENKIYPKKFLELFEPDVLQSLDEPFAAAALEFFAPPAPLLAPNLILLSAFAELCQDDDERGLVIANAVQSALGNSDLEIQTAAAFAFAEVADLFVGIEETARPSGDAIYDLLIPLLIGENALCSRYASLAYRRLIRIGILSNAEFLTKYLATFSQHQHPRFFSKIVEAYLFPDGDEDEEEDEEEEEPKLEILQPVYDWISASLTLESPLLLGVALNGLGHLIHKSKDAGEDLVSQGLAVSGALVSANGFAAFEFIGNFLVAVAQTFGQSHGAQICELLPPLIAALANESSGPLKVRLFTASAIAAVISNDVGAEFLPRLSAFVLDTIPALDDYHLWLSGIIILNLKKRIPTDLANSVFPLFSARTRATDSDEFIAGWLRLLGKLVKRGNVNSEAVAEFTNAILAGGLRIFFGRKPGKCFSLPDTLFWYLSVVIKKAPGIGRAVVEVLLDWFEDVILQATPFLGPVAAGLAVGVFDEALARRLAPIALIILSKCDADEAEDIDAVTKVIAALFAQFPGTLGPLDNVVQSYARLVHSAAESADNGNEEEDLSLAGDAGDLIAIMPQVFQLIVDIYIGSAEVAINEQVLVDIVRLLPFPASVEEQPAILEGLVELVDDFQKFKFMAKPFAEVLVTLLMQKPKELEEYGFASELISGMKKLLKKIVKADKKLETALGQRFKGSKAKFNHFRALIR